MQINPISNSQYKPAFQGGMGVLDRNAQHIIEKKCNAKQFQELKDIFYSQVNDKVFCFIYASKNKKRLEARIQCPYFIVNFKEYYKQIPIFESTFGFIKRMSKRMNKYRAQLQKAEEEAKV